MLGPTGTDFRSAARADALASRLLRLVRRVEDVARPVAPRLVGHGGRAGHLPGGGAAARAATLDFWAAAGELFESASVRASVQLVAARDTAPAATLQAAATCFARPERFFNWGN